MLLCNGVKRENQITHRITGWMETFFERTFFACGAMWESFDSYGEVIQISSTFQVRSLSSTVHCQQKMEIQCYLRHHIPAR